MKELVPELEVHVRIDKRSWFQRQCEA